MLMARARELLENPAQGVLELGVEPMPSALGLIAPASDPGRFSLAGSAAPTGRTGTARVIGTDSRVLFDALASVFTALGFDGLGDEVFRDLVIARVVEPTSLLDAGRVLRDLGQAPASYATMKRTLTRAAAGKYRDQVATWCFEHASTAGDVSLVLYDVTTLYFEAEKEDELRKVGYSKGRRVDPQIVVGLLVDRRGFPLEIGCFEGNKAETATIIPIIKQFRARQPPPSGIRPTFFTSRWTMCGGPGGAGIRRDTWLLSLFSPSSCRPGDHPADIPALRTMPRACCSGLPERDYF